MSSIRKVLALSGVGLLSTLVWAERSRAQSTDALRARIDLRVARVPSVTTAELATWLAQSQVLLLDVRTAEEFAVSHLPDAVWAETPAQQRAAIARAGADARVVLYCSVGLRSGIATERLRSEGVQRAYNLRGSIFEWAGERRPLTDGERDVQVVHPFDRTWGRLLERRFWPPAWRD